MVSPSCLLTVSLHLLLLTQLLLLLHRLQPPQSRQVVSALDWRRIETRVHALTSCERDMREFPEGNGETWLELRSSRRRSRSRSSTSSTAAPAGAGARRGAAGARQGGERCAHPDVAGLEGLVLRDDLLLLRHHRPQLLRQLRAALVPHLVVLGRNGCPHPNGRPFRVNSPSPRADSCCRQQSTGSRHSPRQQSTVNSHSPSLRVAALTAAEEHAVRAAERPLLGVVARPPHHPTRNTQLLRLSTSSVGGTQRSVVCGGMFAAT